jgi:hypothetical protein
MQKPIVALWLPSKINKDKEYIYHSSTLIHVGRYFPSLIDLILNWHSQYNTSVTNVLYDYCCFLMTIPCNIASTIIECVSIQLRHDRFSTNTLTVPCHDYFSSWWTFTYQILRYFMLMVSCFSFFIIFVIRALVNVIILRHMTK